MNMEKLISRENDLDDQANNIKPEFTELLHLESVKPFDQPKKRKLYLYFLFFYFAGTIKKFKQLINLKNKYAKRKSSN